MGKVTAGFSMSLDGFVADVDDGVDQVFKWYSIGDTTAEVQAGDATFRLSTEGAEYIQEAGQAAGVLVSARRTFDIAKAWGGRHPMGVPVVVVTHSPPDEWVNKEGSPFTFVTDGVLTRSPRHKTSPATRTSSWAPQVSRGSASSWGCSTRSTSTWCLSCSARASVSSSKSTRPLNSSSPRHRVTRTLPISPTGGSGGLCQGQRLGRLFPGSLTGACVLR